MKKFYAVGLAALLAAPMAFADEMPTAALAGHVTMLDADFDDGTGFGVRGWGKVGQSGFVHGEYSMVTLSDTDLDVNELRFGGGIMGELQKGAHWLAKAEYIDFGSDLDADGFGLHGGAGVEVSPQAGIFGTVGFIDVGEEDGLEFNIGGKMKFSKELAGILDYRMFSGSNFDVSELRFGVAYLIY
jgi:hypothetical protein